MSSQKKHRRSIIDELFGSLPINETDFSDEFPDSGYSIGVSQTPEGTKVRAKVGKDTDTNALRKQLEQKYPNAQIEIEGGKKEALIKEISTKTIEKENNERQEHE
jgi:hypothetical protein